jgi:hypothetical protein
MIDVRSTHFQSCLHDVIRWCATRPFAGEVDDSPAVVRLRERYGQASHFIDEARQAVGRGWRHRKIQDTEQWKAGQEILAEIVYSLGPAARELRSSSLSPTRPLSSSMSPQDWSQAVAEVVGKRSQMVNRTAVDGTGYAKSGRLLLYFPAENLACGAAQVSSGGFFDADNAPPWDIWVAYEGNALISWVPPGLIVAAQMGIDVNPENCIQWLDQ